jgi:hypothetical protein
MHDDPHPLVRSALTAGLLLGALTAGALAIGACGSSQTSSSSTSRQAARTQATASSSRSAQPRATAPSPQPVPLPCASARLRLTFIGTQGAPGHLEATFGLRNASGTMCSLHGYPGARLLDFAGHAIPTRLRRGGGFFPDTMSPPRRVLLAPSVSAQFGLSFVTNSEYAGARHCVRAAALESVLPDGAGVLRISLTGGGHARIAPCGTQLVTSPVYAG